MASTEKLQELVLTAYNYLTATISDPLKISLGQKRTVIVDEPLHNCGGQPFIENRRIAGMFLKYLNQIFPRDLSYFSWGDTFGCGRVELTVHHT